MDVEALRREAGLAIEWLPRLKAKDQVRVFYQAGKGWYCKDVTISYVAQTHYHFGIPAAASAKLRLLSHYRHYRQNTETGYFSTRTGLRVLKTEADEDYGKDDFIAPVELPIPDGVIFAPQGKHASDIVPEPHFPQVVSSVATPLHDLRRVYDNEYALDARTFKDLTNWLSETDSHSEIGAFWLASSNLIFSIFSLWLQNIASDQRKLLIITPSECGTAELLYRILKELTEAVKGFEKGHFVETFMDLPYEKVYAVKWEHAPIPFPKDTSERRVLLERVYRSSEGLEDIKLVFADSENLKLPALKELIYLNKVLGCPIILWGNEDLGSLIKSAKTDWIEVFDESGHDFDPEFIEQVQAFYNR